MAAWLLSAWAVVKARPGVSVRWRVGRQVSDSDSVLRIELLAVMNQPWRASSTRGSLEKYSMRESGTVPLSS